MMGTDIHTITSLNQKQQQRRIILLGTIENVVFWNVYM